jgi:short-subunit dehydrogenase involved in D-alanine esterification of teichoic acids
MFKKDLLKDIEYISKLVEEQAYGKDDANSLCEHGANIFICGRRENVLKETANEIMDISMGISTLRKH